MKHKTSNTTRIGIIGAGFSGTAIAATLYRLTKQPLEVILIDKTGQFGAGFAYSTPFVYHLLNVRANDMSAFENDSQHFVNWLKANESLCDQLDKSQSIGEQFVPRLFYGKYLQDLLRTIQEDTASKLTLKLVSGEVTDVLTSDSHIQLMLQDGASIDVDKVILALGNGSPALFPFPVAADIQRIDNPWHYSAVNTIPSHEPVMIVGTGLSMIDAVLTLHHQKHQGLIYTLSRHGLLPLPHNDNHETYTIDLQPTKSLSALVKQLRQVTKSHTEQGGDWRSVITELRRHLPTLWEHASLRDRKLFFRHLMPYWNIHRHRVHVVLHQLLADLSNQGQLKVIAGRVNHVTDGKANIKLRHQDKNINVDVKWLINCMGPSLNITSSHQPLASCLQRRNEACFDPLNLGFVTTKTGALKTAADSESSTFYSLGPPTKGMTWECMAVPGIRKQVLKIAEQLTA